MTDRNLAAVLGFAFVAAWVGFNLGYAVLCLVGAGVAVLIAGVWKGDVDLGDLQERATGRRGAGDDLDGLVSKAKGRVR